MGLGAFAFFVSSQVLEKMVHLLILHPQKRWNHSAYAGAAFLIRPLWDRYGSPL